MNSRGEQGFGRAVRALIALSSALLLMACAHAGTRPDGAASAAVSAPVSAMTFNIRLDLPADGANAWPQRKDLVFALIRHEAPDLLGMQEVLLHQKRDLEAALPEYAMIGAGRDDGREAGEFSPLAWRRDRFDLVRSGTFWLSPTPETPGKAWDAALPRIASWAVLRERRSGELLRVLNTHFDHMGTEARANSAKLIGQWVTSGRDAGLPTIVMGDFNAPTGSEPYRLLADTAATSLSDTRGLSTAAPYGPRGTFTGFRIDTDAPDPIDHIFVSRHFQVDRHAVITQHWGGRLPSDHYPVLAELRVSRP
ncbi:endonuclease/exonuclease/phosphatase family protein [Allopontixanthobacter sp.]|uniref:endonuclease/exonuclease/phosphatase family protein n=1 Tax=Allopontixanthobacter sp. TaxID=2906452 RepID=UPI002AB89AA2|nr:endonuclease/exonuclease/phosphatase family protein [Allopontixanthobacter sp.]MDZ4307513.1 endonuclease/exonuclease/phosphatase family protein [Allopontixanthobacter sp.]